MSEDEIEKWSRDGRNKELPVSPSCSSFEVLDPHDPVISRLATQLFKRTNDYLQGEMAASQGCGYHTAVALCKNQYLCKLPRVVEPGLEALLQDHYNMLEEINRLTIIKYADLRNLAVNLNKTLTEYNEMYNQVIKPLLLQIDQIDAQVSRFEVNAYRLDAYTKQLKARFKELEEK